LELSGGRSVRPSASAVDVAILAGAVAPIRTDQLSYQLGVEQELVTGTRYGFSLNGTRLGGPNTVFDPNYSSEVSFNVTQPLLKGLGPAVNRTAIVLARNNFSIAVEELEDEALQLALLVEETYWDLVFQRMRLAVEKERKRAAVELLEANRAKVREGILPPIEVLVAEAAVADREENILIAEKLVRDTEDELRLIMNEESDDLIEEVPVIPRDTPVRERPGMQSGEAVGEILKEALDLARERRPDLQRARLEKENRGEAVHRAANAVLPALDFEGRTGLSGLGETQGDDFDRLTSGDFSNWQVGLVLSMPLGNRTARNTLDREKLEARRAELTLIRLEQDLTIEVKEAVRR
ncbi:MAG TPA: TolC family protein, partial [Nitrospiria bacterium]|nr:TolC family protein [Nitrospiria bacterium]